MACCAYRGQLWLEPTALEALLPQHWSGSDTVRWGAGAVHFLPRPGEGIARAVLDSAGEVVLSTRRPGLRMRVGVGRPRRSFKKLCQEADIPAWMRDRLPVLWVDGEPAWIGGIGFAADFTCPASHAGLVPQWRKWQGRSQT